MKPLKFKGLTITKEDFEIRYDIKLTEAQWNHLVSETSRTWVEQSDELRLLAFKHIRSAMEGLGYGVDLDGKEVVFRQRIKNEK